MEGEGFFTNLINEGNNSYDWDSLSSMPVEDDMSNRLDENGMSSEPVTQQLPTVERTTVPRPNQKRSKNFSEQEDKILVSAWLHKASTDGLGKAIPTNDDTTNHVDEDNESTETEEPKRPMGKKRAKVQLSRGGGKPPRRDLRTCEEAAEQIVTRSENGRERDGNRSCSLD
uniref:Uncharacterized protein n=1 Tax=Oryza meridionalis TaxID=40149 RepID=A0A0E0C1J1_9ORYZ